MDRYKNHNVVKLQKNTVVKEVSQDIIHQGLKGVLVRPKGMTRYLKVSIEGCFPLIPFLDPD